MVAMRNSEESTHPNRAAFPAGMSGPSLRALHRAGVRRLADLTTRSEADISALHGMGPKGVRLLREALKEKGLGFRGTSR